MSKANEVLIYIKDKVNLQGLKTLQTRLGKVRTSIKAAFASAPVRAFKTAVLGVAAALVTAVVEGAKFNVQMSRVWTMAGGGIKNFKALRKEARGLAADFGKSRSEIAKGMYNALSAGIDRSNLESFMRSAAQVAVADGSDISVAVDGITTVLNAFSIEAGKTEEVTDLLFQTVRQGKTTFGELSSSLSNVASTAASAGVPLEQVLAHISALTAQGTPTAQATTQIRQSILGLNKALGDGWSAHMSYQDALKAVWSQAGQSQTKLLELVGSTEAMQAVLGGVGKNAGMAADKLAGMSDAAGAAQEAFEKVNQFRHWPTLIETARGFISKLGEHIDAALKPAVESITEKIKDWTNSDGLWDKIAGVIDAAAQRINVAVNQAKEIFGKINSLADLKVLAETIGDWLKAKLVEGGKSVAAYLTEKAPAIGDAIGRAAKKAMGRPDRLTDDQSTSLRYKAGQEHGFNGYLPWNKDHRESYSRLKGEQISENRNGRLASEGKDLRAQVELSESSMRTFGEIFTQNLQQSRGGGAEGKLAALLASGMSKAQIDEAICNMELTYEELATMLDALDAATANSVEAVDAANQTAESANEMQQATAESLDATTKAHDALKITMTQATVAAQQSTQAAQQNGQLLEQTVGLIEQLRAEQAISQMRINNLEFDIQSMKV